MKKYNIGWGITNACIMNCKFCYSKDVRKNSDLTTFDDWISFIDQNHDYIDSINYGTGENALVEDFFKLISYIRKNYPSITQSVTTNGYFGERVSRNKDFYNSYVESIDEIDVSLDFASKEEHNYFRGQSKAYEWVMKTLKMAKDDGKKITIVFVGCEETMTRDNIDGLFKIAKEYDALIRMNIYRPVSNDSDINKRFILSYDTLTKMLEYINEKYQVVSLNDVLFANIYTKDAKIKENTGINSIRILPDGSISPSTFLVSNEYNNKYNIKQGLVLSKLEFKNFVLAPIPDKCKNCLIREQCRGGVYDRRILWYRTLDEKDPYCPYENGDDLNNKLQINPIKKGRISVHDGYLPTMFFKN